MSSGQGDWATAVQRPQFRRVLSFAGALVLLLVEGGITRMLLEFRRSIPSSFGMRRPLARLSMLRPSMRTSSRESTSILPVGCGAG
jgi:hypothetical protein